jgi:hypothetical protein
MRCAVTTNGRLEAERVADGTERRGKRVLLVFLITFLFVVLEKTDA